ncbi:hypothetical protein ACIBSV_37440 [Embleya sp. NPDC050154]|uniref:hypothetical protein n=1 Tax=unclassified Embleya TaxID=2699296 RepID=UPI0037A45DB3
MDVLSPYETYLLAVVTLGLVRTVLLRLMMVAALALVLRGSDPGERPALLSSFAECLLHMARSTIKHRRGSERTDTRRR